MALHPWHDVELPEDLEEPIPAIIEIPMHSKVKYELDKQSGMLVVDRILFSAVHYPANYGFVPRTYCGDGDPLDILVFCQEPIASLALMRAKVIGVMKMRDDKGEDDKLIAVHADDPEYSSYSDLWQLPPHRLRELKRFFEDYKALERKSVVVSDPLGRDEALKVLREAIRFYAENAEALKAGREVRLPAEPLETAEEVMPSVDLEAPPEAPIRKPRRTAAKAAGAAAGKPARGAAPRARTVAEPAKAGKPRSRAASEPARTRSTRGRRRR